MQTRDIISKFPINADKKLQLYGKFRKMYWRLKYNPSEYAELMKQFCFIPQNSNYGHEYWLKRYSSYNKDICALIEHGLHFKCLKAKIGWETEWDLGSIITFGNSRYEVLRKWYPNYNIVRIGPRIHYVPLDRGYLKEIKSKIDPGKKTMALFPAHSLANEKSNYDVDSFLNDALDFAKENDK